MAVYIKYSILLLSALFTFFYANAIPLELKVNALWKKYNQETTAKNKIDILLGLSRCYEMLEKREMTDSVTGMALSYAETQGNDTLLIKVYNSYFDKDDLWDKQNRLFPDNERALLFARNMIDIATGANNNLWLGMAYSAQSKVEYNLLNKKEDGIASMNRAYYHYSQIPGDTLKFRCLLDVGLLQLFNNRKSDAFGLFLDALYGSKKTNNVNLEYWAYERLAVFYRFIGNYSKAKSYNLKMFPIVLTASPIDSEKLMNLKFGLATIMFNNNEYQEAKRLTYEILNYAKRNNLNLLKNTMLFNYRGYLYKKDKKSELAELYSEKYPEELQAIERTEKPQFYRIKAMIADIGKHPDSAEYYYNLAEQSAVKQYTNTALLSQFYLQPGMFLWRENRLAEARAKLEKAFDYASKSKFLPFIIDISASLDSLAYIQNDLASAYRYSKINKQYTEALAISNKQDEVLKLELENELRQRELAAEREQQEIERRHNIQYMGMTLMIGVVFIFLITLGSFKVPRMAIRAVNFLSFIFLFEFIILLIDHKVHTMTHGEPWKILGIKIVIIAGLLPLHHWVEEKFVHYLTTHKLIDTSKIKLKPALKKIGSWMKKTKPTEQPFVLKEDEVV
jgi:hypothetical protein